MSVKNDSRYGCQEFYLQEFEPLDSSPKTLFPESQAAPLDQLNDSLVSYTRSEPVDGLESTISKASNLGKRKLFDPNAFDTELETSSANDLIGNLPQMVSYDPWLSIGPLDPIPTEAVATDPGLTPDREASAQQDAIRRVENSRSRVNALRPLAQRGNKVSKKTRSGDVQSSSILPPNDSRLNEVIQNNLNPYSKEHMEKAEKWFWKITGKL